MTASINDSKQESLSSSIDEDSTQQATTSASCGNGIDVGFLQARSLDAIPSKRIVAAAGSGGGRGGRRRRATAPARQSAARRTSTAGRCDVVGDGNRNQNRIRFASERSTGTLLHPETNNRDDAVAEDTRQTGFTFVAKPVADLGMNVDNNNSDMTATTSVSSTLPTNDTVNSTSSSVGQNALSETDVCHGAVTGRPSPVVVSAPTLFQGRHFRPKETSPAAAINDATSTATWTKAASSRSEGIISRSTADVKHDRNCGSSDLSPSESSRLDTGQRKPPQSAGAVIRGGDARLSFDVNPLRRWSHQRAVGTVSADCWLGGGVTAPEDRGSVMSIYATPREHLSPDRDPIFFRTSTPVNRPPPDVIGKAADAERANVATSASYGGNGNTVRRISMSTCGQYVREQLMSFSQPSDNRLAMKLFGNKNAFVREKLRRSQLLTTCTVIPTGGATGIIPPEEATTRSGSGSWLIHPCSNFRYEIISLLFSIMKFFHSRVFSVVNKC